MCSDDPDYAEASEYEKSLVKESDQLWNQYKENYIPLENQMIEQLSNKRGAANKQYNINSAVNAARMKTPATLKTGAGMQPGSGNFSQVSNAAQQQTGHAAAMGATAGYQSAEDQYMSGMLGLTQHGRGQQAQGLQGTSQLMSNQYGMDMAELSAKQYANSAKWGAIGSIAGAGAAYYGNKYDFFKKPTTKTTP